MTRTALVTGGTRGLGRAIAVALKEAGHRVAAVYHGNEEAARRFREATSIAVYRWDVADFDACRAGIARVEDELGPVEILVNNAGITRDASLHHMTLEQWRAVIDTNLGSMFNMCRNVVEGMRQRGFGRIVNISSINGQKGQFGQANYSAAKAGILGFTKALALEGAHRNITVNAIAPGYCDTDMVAAVPQEVLKSIVAGIPVGRLGAPRDIARMAVFLASDDAGFITGATFAVNGGQYMAG
jgi:acetoacetyl-CoA reductase